MASVCLLTCNLKEHYSRFGVSLSTTLSELGARSRFLPHVLLHDQESAFWNPQCKDALFGHSSVDDMTAHAIEFEDLQDSTSNSPQGDSRLHTTLCEDAIPVARPDTLRSANFVSDRHRDAEFTTWAASPPSNLPNLGACIRDCITVCSSPRNHIYKSGASAKRCHTPSHSKMKGAFVKRRKTTMQGGKTMEAKIPKANEENEKSDLRVSHNQVERNYRDRLNNGFGRLLEVLQAAEHEDLKSVELVDESRSHSKGDVLWLARQRILSLETENRLISGEVKRLREKWDGQHIVDISNTPRPGHLL